MDLAAARLGLKRITATLGGWGPLARVALALALGSPAAAPPAAALGAPGSSAALARVAAAAEGAGAATTDTAAGGSQGAAGGGESEAALDAVVQEVLRMLQAKVSEPVIVHWLDTTGRRPAAMGSREIVALARAGASDPLMRKLLDLAARTDSGPAAATPASPAAAPTAAAPRPAAAPVAPPPAAPRPAATPAAPPPAAPGLPLHAAPMHWRIAYHPNFGPDDERWDLYVYLDGRYLAAVKSPVVSFLDPPIEFDRVLAPGHHVLRVVEERHLRKLGREGWKHEAKVAPAALAFDVAPDAAGRVDLQCETRPRGGPISLRVTQGDAELARAEPAIGQPDAWPWLCEEVAAGRRPSRAARGEPGSCLHWAELWPGVEAPPSREAVRADLERRGFRPDPARDGQ